MSCVFFYGLFMDVGLLTKTGLAPTVLGPARLRDYQLRIGDRATLVPKTGAIAYGMLMELTDSELTTLYAAPGVSDYRPYTVETERLEGGAVQSALCYNLSTEPLDADFNAEYAKALSDLLLKLGFPASYAHELGRLR